MYPLIYMVCVYGTLYVPSVDIHACIYMVYMNVYVSSFLSLPTLIVCVYMYVCVYTYMYVCVYTCMCVCVYVYVCVCVCGMLFAFVDFGHRCIINISRSCLHICGETWHTSHQQPVTVSTSIHAPTLISEYVYRPRLFSMHAAILLCIEPVSGGFLYGLGGQEAMH